jgi:hypothetical protein
MEIKCGKQRCRVGENVHEKLTAGAGSGGSHQVGLPMPGIGIADLALGELGVVLWGIHDCLLVLELKPEENSNLMSLTPRPYSRHGAGTYDVPLKLMNHPLRILKMNGVQH